MAEDVPANSLSPKTYTGHCHCGDVIFCATGLSDIWYCHCKQCQHLSGHMVAAAGVSRDGLSYEGEVRWSEISENTNAGHCARCHSYLFWSNEDLPNVSILTGNLDNTDGLCVKGHIFVAEKKTYFEIIDGLPQYDAYPPQGTR